MNYLLFFIIFVIQFLTLTNKVKLKIKKLYKNYIKFYTLKKDKFINNCF